MFEHPYHFDAFISYRHTDRDKKVVDTIQKLTENFRSPCDGAHIRKGDRIRRLFTDRSELPMSADLGASITDALSQSRFLLVIASPEYLQSRWCMEELRTFLRYHQNSTEQILFVQVAGTPSCITDILRAAGVPVEVNTFREPLYINACTPTVTETVKIIKREYLRLAAVLIGCGYDSLYQRHKRAKWRKILIFSGLAVLITAVICTVFAIQDLQRKQEAAYRSMDASITDIRKLLREEDRVAALEIMQTLYDQYGQDKAYSAYLVDRLESTAVEAGYVPAFSAFAAEPLPFELSGMSVSSDGNYVIVYDIASTRQEGKMRIFLYDAYLHKLSEHTLPVEEWKQQIIIARQGKDRLHLDYHEADDQFELEILSDNMYSKEDITGIELMFSADGKLLSRRELSAEEIGQPSARLRTIYWNFWSQWSGLVGLSEEYVYSVFTEGETNCEPIGKKDEEYLLISVSPSADIDIVTTLTRSSDTHAIDTISCTPDGRFVLVKETRGIHNDVLTVCDLEGQLGNTRIDLGSHSIQYMHYRFDTENQEARFLFGLALPNDDEKGMVAECRIAPGQPPNCEMYNCNFLYECLLSSQGYVYILEDSRIKAVATENMCLPERMAGMAPTAEISTDAGKNDLIGNGDSYSHSTGDMQSISTGNLTVTPDVVRIHHDTPALYTGADNGIGIHHRTGDELVSFFAPGNVYAYYNAKDRVFGLLDFDSPEKTQAFRLYTFYELIDLLR